MSNRSVFVGRWRKTASMNDIGQARKDFASAAEQAALATVKGPIKRFAPGSRMSRHAHWFVTNDDSVLIAVVSPAEKHTIADEVLAYGLAWQRNRDLHLVLPPAMLAGTLTRLPWIEAPVRVWEFEEGEGPRPVPTLARVEVFDRLLELPPRISKKTTLTPELESWMAGVNTAGLEAHNRSYLSWHYQGLQVLKVRNTRKGLRIQAGVQYSGKSATAKPYDRTFVAAPTADDLAEIKREIAGAVEHGESKSAQMREHRMQATLKSQASDLGMKYLLREYPAYRGLDGSDSKRAGRPGYIDFLGVDAKGGLHVVETKIGHDPRVVLQALDYAIWVRANEEKIRARLRASGLDVRESKRNGDRLHMHLVLAPDAKGVAFNAYLAPQIEALRGDCYVEVHLVPDVKAAPLELRTLAAKDYWTPAPMVAKPVEPQRWAGTLTRALMGDDT
jgi:hypothetical protein